MKKIKNTSYIITYVLIVLSIVASIALSNLTFVPNAHNTMVAFILISGIITVFQILRFIYGFLVNKEIIKVISLVIFTIALLATLFYAFVIYLLANKDGHKFNYENKEYYYTNDSFLDPMMTIYKKDSALIMTKIGSYFGEDLDTKINAGTAIKILKENGE